MSYIAGNIFVEEDGKELQQLNSTHFVTRVCGNSQGLYFLTADRKILQCVEQKFVELELNDIVYMCCGKEHFCALKEDGSLFSWGLSSQGQL